MPIPRTGAERAAQDQHMAEVMLGHPVMSEFPKGAVEALAAIADGQTLDADDVRLLVHTALAAIVTAEVLTLREATR